MPTLIADAIATRPPSAHPLVRRGTVAVALIVALVILSLVVVGMAMSGSMHQSATALGVQGTRSQYAADAAGALAIKEIMDNVDRDGDGGIGTISNDGNTATDPVISGTRLWATKSGSVVTARGANNDAARAAQVTVTTGSSAGAATILLVTADSALNAQETARQNLFTGWGYTVVTIADSAAAGTYDTTCRTVSAAYVPETVDSATLGTKLTNQTIPVINDEGALADELGFSTTNGTFNSSQIDITNNSHYITSTFSTGNRTICTSSQPLHTMTGTLGGYTSLAEQVSSSNQVLGVMQRGAALCGGGTAAGRRVHLPWAGSGFDINTLNSNGLTILQRSLEWCLLPIAHWKLDETSGSTAADSQGAYNGTKYGPTWNSAGKLNGCLIFDGGDDYVSIANNSAFQVTRALTIAAWIRGDTWGSGSYTNIILRKGDDNPNNWQLAINGGKIEFILDASDGAGYRGNTTLSTGAWHHVAATWDGTNARVYLNGVSDHSAWAKAAPIGTDSRPIYLGGRTGPTDCFDGRVDDVRFYNRALTAAEIAELASPSSSVDSWQMVAP